MAPIFETLRPSLESARATWLLGDAERLAAGYSEPARQRMRALVRAAQDRAFVAEQALEGHVATALTLYREAALLYLAAAVTVGGGDPLAEPLDGEQVVARFRASPKLRTPPDDLDAFLELVRRPAAMSVEGGPAFDGERARELVAWLRTLVEPRGVPELRFLRGVRLAAASLVLLALLAWSLSGIGARKNVALHKPVTASGVFPNATSQPSGLTDGVIVGAPYGVHTNVGESTWVQVDLLAVYAIDRVKIYNRSDGWLDDCLPLTLQLSENGTTFLDVETRTASFGQKAPWIAKAHGKRARYVRIRGAPRKYVTLSELEVFAR